MARRLQVILYDTDTDENVCNEIDVTEDLIAGNLRTELESGGSISFTIPKTHKYYDNFDLMIDDIEVREDDFTIWYGRIVETRIDFFRQKHITAEGALTFLKDTYSDDQEYNTTTHALFKRLIDIHNSLFANLDRDSREQNKRRKFKVGTIDVPDKAVTAKLEYKNIWDAIEEHCRGISGGYFIVDGAGENLTIRWLKDVSERNEQGIEYGNNIEDISKQTVHNDIITGVVAYTNSVINVTIVNPDTGEIIGYKNDYFVSNAVVKTDNSTIITKYGIHYTPKQFNNIYDNTTLIQTAKDYINSQFYYHDSINVKIADLHYLDRSDSFRVGQFSEVTADKHLLFDEKFPITSIDYNITTGVKDVNVGMPSHNNLGNRIWGKSGRPFGYNYFTSDGLYYPNRVLAQALSTFNYPYGYYQSVNIAIKETAPMFYTSSTEVINYLFWSYVNYGALLRETYMPRVVNISFCAFLNQSNLTKVYMPKVTYIDRHAFVNCYNLSSVEMSKVTYIGNGAFENCRNLTSVEMPKVTYIGNGAFGDCRNLTSVEMSNVDTIDDFAFYWCNNLTTVYIPRVVNIGYGAFYNCYNLSSVEMSNAINVINNAFGWCYNLTSVEMPNVTYIGNDAFNGCYRLQSVEMPNVTYIGDIAFNICENLSSVEMSNVTNIGYGAFYNCYNLTSVYIPKVTYIGYAAFAYCYKADIYVNSGATIGDNAFYRVNSVTYI